MNARSIAALVALALAGCSGGGSVTPPAAPAPVASAASTTQSSACAKTADGTKQSCTITIVVPAKGVSTSTTSRSAQYVSPSTQSITVAIATTPVGQYTFTPTSTLVFNLTQMSCTTSGGTQTCSASLPPFGLTVDEGLVVNAYDGLNGTGNVLSTNQDDAGPGVNYAVTLCGIDIGFALSCTATLGGFPKTFVVSQATLFTDGIPSSSVFTVTAYDADGNQIVLPLPADAWAGLADGSTTFDMGVVGPNSHLTFTSTPGGSTCTNGTHASIQIGGPACTFTVNYDGTTGYTSKPIAFEINDGVTTWGSLTGASALFYTTKIPAACSPPATLTIPVGVPLTNAISNGPPSC